jgi:2-C-methyl-D-erythritol 2,4-cyclodiphosphate synthase
MIRDDTATNSERRVALQMRTGIGYDAHRFAAGRRLVLGGVEIRHDQGLAGHSDADVLLHAIADAVLGAAALGDIGQHFPPTDERFRDANSEDLLREVVRLAWEAGWAPGNVDATLLAEAPRIGPHVPSMRERIAACLGISPEAVGVKATTNEGMGAIGRGEGIAALATVTLVPVRTSPER